MKYTYTQDENGDYVCLACDKHYGTKRGYRYHITNEHDGVEPEMNRPGDEPETAPEEIMTQIDKAGDELDRDEQFQKISKAVKQFNHSLAEASVKTDNDRLDMLPRAPNLVVPKVCVLFLYYI